MGLPKPLKRGDKGEERDSRDKKNPMSEPSSEMEESKRERRRKCDGVRGKICNNQSQINGDVESETNNDGARLDVEYDDE